MTHPMFQPAELLQLDPAELRTMVDMCPGEHVSVRAAVLGLDIDTPEHRAALRLAFPEAFYGLDWPPAEESGVRHPLTPDPAPEPEGYTGEGPAGDDAQSAVGPADPDGVDIAELLHRYRGSAEPFLCGTFAMYSAPDGSIVIVTDMPDRGVEQRAVPAHVVRLALGAAAGKGAMLGRLFGGR